MKNQTNTDNLDFAGSEPIIGLSPDARRLRQAVEKLAKTNRNVLLVGEAGTGKKFIAHKIFNGSGQSSKSLVSIDCAALGKTINLKELYGEIAEGVQATSTSIGLLEKANEGMLLLENLGAMNYEYQEIILNLLRDGIVRKIGDSKSTKINLRVVSTSQEDLLPKVEIGQFKRELYFRLNELVLVLTALRNRKQDIPVLFSYFLKKLSEETGIEAAAVTENIFESILTYDWHGNIGELKDMVRNLVSMSKGDELSSEYLPFRVKKNPLEFLEPDRLKKATVEVQVYLINKALRKFSGNQVKAARLLGMPEATLRFKMKKFGFPSKQKN
jgi:DNA-binding NtrC family response regulator